MRRFNPRFDLRSCSFGLLVFTLSACTPSESQPAAEAPSEEPEAEAAKPEPEDPKAKPEAKAPPASEDPELAAIAKTLAMPEACGEVRSFEPSEAFVQELLDEPEHFGIYLGAAKIGWATQSAKRVEASEGQPAAIRLELEVSVALIQDLPGEPEMRTELHAIESATFAASAPYGLLRMDNRMKMDSVEETQTVEHVGGFIVLDTNNDGTSHREVFRPFEYDLGDFVASQLWLAKEGAGLDAGASVTTLDFDLEDDAKHRLGCQKATLVRNEEVWLDGVKQRQRTLEVISLVDPGEATSVETYDDQGQPIRMETQGFEMRSEPEDVAKAAGEGGRISPYSVLTVDKAIGDSDKLARLEVVIEGASPESFASTSMQQVHAHEDGVRLIIDVRRPFPPAPSTERDRELALEASATYPVADPGIVELAAKAIGDAATPSEKVERLVAFVHGYMNFDHSNGSVLRTLESRSGDCTETSELFTTLARAVGVPARTVGGFGYTDDSMRTFGGHAWNEVLLDGDWISVDATWGQVRADPSHIQESDRAEMVLEERRVRVLGLERG